MKGGETCACIAPIGMRKVRTGRAQGQATGVWGWALCACAMHVEELKTGEEPHG